MADPSGTDKQPEPSTSAASTLASVQRSVEDGIQAAKTLVDSSLQTASQTLITGAQQGATAVNQGLEVSSKYLGEGKAYVDQAIMQLKAIEDQALGHVKGALDVVATTSPYITYPVFAASALLILPGTRRMLYRSTIGRLRSPDAIYQSAEGRVEGLRSKVEECGNEVKKLHERMVTAEEEMKRGMSKLKATRQQLQRLESVVAKSEKSAAGVLDDLRSIKKVEKAPQLRAEAASQLAALRSQRSSLQKYIYRIAVQDI